jgi:hypothetical protein
MSDKRTGVTRCQPTVDQKRHHLIGQRQQPQQIGDMAPALAKNGGQLFLGMTKAIHELPIAGGLVNRGKIGPLDVLDDRDFENLGIGVVANKRRDFVQLRNLGCAPPAFTGDDLVHASIAGIGPHDQGLDNAPFPD